MDNNQPPALCKRCQNSVDDQYQITDQTVDPRFLHWDYILSDEERYKTKQILEEKERRLQHHEEEIMQIRRRLLVVEEEKRVLEDDIVKCRSALGIWRKFPSEILEMIFEITCFSSSNSGHSLVIGTSRLQRLEPILITSPLSLSHVCSRWRSIVLDSPKLWSTICIKLDNVPDNALRLLQTFIERSGRWPLSIRLSSDSHDDPPPRHILDLWEVLLENSSRWTALDLRLMRDAKLLESDPAPRFSKLSFSSLISFEASIYPEQIDPDNRFWKSLHRAPKLTGVTTRSLYPIHTLPYKQLTTLTIDYDSRLLSDNGSLELLVGVLQITKNLCHLTFDAIGSVADIGLNEYSSVVQMPSLRSLKLRCSGFGTCSLNTSKLLLCLFTSLRMPVLDTFDLTCLVKGIRRWPESFLAMLDRSSSLQRLSLWFKDFDEPDFQPEEPFSTILQTTPNLTHLQIRISTRKDLEEGALYADEYLSSFVSDLKCTSQRPTLLPKLEHFSFFRNLIPMCDPIFDPILVGLLEVAKSRGPRYASLPLRTIQLRWYDFRKSKPFSALGSELLEEIDNLKKDGLSVDFDRAWRFKSVTLYWEGGQPKIS
ncbi:hypothetical protein L218DRAFT_300866 [Marasmius fiardii PR-910]|nr:hypothetical protein L218DRAFT_300866 [Marasmius fiardii PR-910]